MTVVEGIVSCIKYAHPTSESTYFVVGKAGASLKISSYRSKTELKLGEAFSAEETCGVLSPVSILSNRNEYEGMTDAFVTSSLKRKPERSGISQLDRITRKIEKSLYACAAIMAKKLVMGAPVLVRFHNDADGSTGAYSLYKSIDEFVARPEFASKPKIIWKMHRSVMYTLEDSAYDKLMVNQYSSTERPLLVIIDFGTSEESNGGYNAIKEKCDVIWLDHHPIKGKIDFVSLPTYINPWQHGGDSNYTAGFLAAQLSKFFSDFDAAYMEDASLIGDHSVYARNTEYGRDLSTLLDLLTSDKSAALGSSDSNLTPYEIDTVISDEGKSRELVIYANARIKEHVDAAFESMKRHNTRDADIYVVDFSKVRDGNSSERHPLPGRFASKLLDYIDENKDKPSILILHYGKYISIRINKSLEGTVGLGGIIEGMKEGNKTSIESGGGHETAASIKLLDESEKRQILNQLISNLKEKLGKS
jgi:RecJ-like exonuclease